MRDVLVGGGGWVSRAALNVLKTKLGIKSQNIKVFGSSPRIESFDNGETLKIDQWGSNLIERDVRYFLPFAFLTADKFDLIGEENYRRENLKLIQDAKNFIAQNNPKYCILISSGIVHSNLSISKRPRRYQVYRELKLEEEYVLRNQCEISGTNLTICRLFSASGRHIPDYLRYAISNLVYQGMCHGSIAVVSESPVFRKYIDMEQLLEICLLAVQNERLLEFDSTGQLVELQELAKLCSEMLGVNYKRISYIKEDADNYYSSSFDSENLAKTYKISLFPLEQQIRETILGVENIVRSVPQC